MDNSNPRCIRENAAAQFCLSKNCSLKFICSNTNCECNSIHLGCLKINWCHLLNKISANKSKNSPAFKSMTNEIYSLFTNVKKYIQIAESQFLNWEKQLGTEKEMELLKLLRQQNFAEIRKDMVQQVFHEINSEYSCELINEKLKHDEVEQMRKGLQILLDQIKNIYKNSILIVKRECLDKNSMDVNINHFENRSSIKKDELISRILEIFGQNNIKDINQRVLRLQIKETFRRQSHKHQLYQTRQIFNQKINDLENQLLNHLDLKMFEKSIKKMIKNKTQLILTELNCKELEISRLGNQYLNTPLKNLKKQTEEMKQLIQSTEKYLKQIPQKFQIILQEIKKNIQEIKISSIRGFFEKPISALKLLYRASLQNFQITKFWEKCNKKKNTLILIKTEFKKVIGGYTALAWDSEKSRLFGNSFVSDQDLTTFLISLSQGQKFQLKSNSVNAIGHCKSWGPRFGDISICNKADIQAQSYGDIGNNFVHKQYEYGKQQSRTRFTGQEIGYKFRIQQWEVYQIQFQSCQ